MCRELLLKGQQEWGEVAGSDPALRQATGIPGAVVGRSQLAVQPLDQFPCRGFGCRNPFGLRETAKGTVASASIPSTS